MLVPRVIFVVATAVVFGIAFVLLVGAPASLAQHATPGANSPVAISSEVLGRAVPVAIEDSELALGRGTTVPGAAIPTHYHPGTRIGVVVQGELTYEVFTGEIAWHRRDDPTVEPYMISAGETVVIRPRDPLIDTPGSIDQGRNAGDVLLVIYLSTLFPPDAPRSIIVDATPVP